MPDASGRRASRVHAFRLSRSPHRRLYHPDENRLQTVGDRFAAMAFLEAVSVHAFDRLERELSCPRRTRGSFARRTKSATRRAAAHRDDVATRASSRQRAASAVDAPHASLPFDRCSKSRSPRKCRRRVRARNVRRSHRNDQKAKCRPSFPFAKRCERLPSTSAVTPSSPGRCMRGRCPSCPRSKQRKWSARCASRCERSRNATQQLPRFFSKRARRVSSRDRDHG